VATRLEIGDLALPVVTVRLPDDRWPREAGGMLALHGEDGVDDAAKEVVGVVPGSLVGRERRELGFGRRNHGRAGVGRGEVLEPGGRHAQECTTPRRSRGMMPALG